jgi:hypothetical protein
MASKDKSKRGANYSSVECVGICRAYCRAKNNPRKGSDQTADQYHDDVYYYYKSNFCAKDAPDRGLDAVISKFKEISQKCLKFTSFVKLAKREELKKNDRSGETAFFSLPLTRAYELYENSQTKAFEYYDCWLILKDQPKWNPDFTGSVASGEHHLLWTYYLMFFM